MGNNGSFTVQEHHITSFTNFDVLNQLCHYWQIYIQAHNSAKLPVFIGYGRKNTDRRHAFARHKGIRYPSVLLFQALFIPITAARIIACFARNGRPLQITAV